MAGGVEVTGTGNVSHHPSVQASPVLQQQQINSQQTDHLINLQWQELIGYHRDYVQDMTKHFMKSITKGPRLDFPRFPGCREVMKGVVRTRISSVQSETHSLLFEGRITIK